MEQVRKPLQGIWNIVRFNRHFYLIAAIMIICISLISQMMNQPYRIFGYVICGLIIITTLVSLIVSLYVYDLSGFYELNWLSPFLTLRKPTVLNIHAGFDETSELVQQKFPGAALAVLDFYDPKKHTEVSIKRARKAYPSYPGTKQVTTADLPMQNNSQDIILLILAAHEIRNKAERIIFFKELGRILKNSGAVIVTEHLRDIPNFLAYNIGFFHFLSESTWRTTFADAGFKIEKEISVNPFIKTFMLTKYGTAS